MERTNAIEAIFFYISSNISIKNSKFPYRFDIPRVNGPAIQWSTYFYLEIYSTFSIQESLMANERSEKMAEVINDIFFTRYLENRKSGYRDELKKKILIASNDSSFSSSNFS